MKRALPILLAVLAPAALPAQTNNVQKPMSVEIDGYAAKVNDRVITRGEVREAMAPMLPELYRAFQGAKLDEELKKAYERTRDELVERALVMEAFKTRGGQIPDHYVDEEIKRIINDRFKGDEAGFEQLLSQQKKTRAEYRETIREQMVVGMMINEEISARARVTPEQVRSAYEKDRERYFIPEKVKFSVVVLNKGETPEDQAVKRAEAAKVRQRLLDGADFAETAKEVSEGSRAAEGGAFPWMQPADARTELQDLLRTLPAGAISEIVETDEQFYIVKVEARQQPTYKSFDDVRLDIKNALVALEQARLKARWIERLKADNYVVIYE